jgi:hypothetical protein
MYFKYRSLSFSIMVPEYSLPNHQGYCLTLAGMLLLAYGYKKLNNANMSRLAPYEALIDALLINLPNFIANR